MQNAKVQVSPSICPVLLEPKLFAHKKRQAKENQTKT